MAQRMVAHLTKQDVHEAASCVLSDALASTISFYPLDQFGPVPGGDPETFEAWRTKHQWAECTPPKWHLPSGAEVTPPSSVLPVGFEQPPVLLVNPKSLVCGDTPNRATGAAVTRIHCELGTWLS